MPNLPKRQKRRAYIPKRKPTHGSDAYNFHNSQTWRRLSIQLRKEQPMCEVFPTLPADVVDHIVPLAADDRGYPLPTGGAPKDRRNLMCMSHKAHNIKRGKEAHGFQVDAVMTDSGLVPERRDDIIYAINKKKR